jgi:hypothetical protein
MDSRPGPHAAGSLLLPLTAILVALGYFPGSNALRWAVLSVMVPLTLVRLPRAQYFSQKAGPTWWLLSALLGYALLSTLWSLSWTEALNGWWQLCVFGGCILLGSLAPATALALTYRVLAVALLPSVALAILQATSGPVLGIDFAPPYPAGLFLNSQLFGEIAALGFLIAPLGGITQLGLLLGVILSASRTAMIAVAVTGGILYARALRRGSAGPVRLAALVGLLGIAVGLFLALTKSMDAANGLQTVHEGMLARVSSGRWSLWLDTLRGTTVFGHGIGSYFVEMPRHVRDFPIATYRPEYAENEFLHFAFELGIPGVLLLAGIFVRSFFCAEDLTLRLIVLALFLEACLGFALHIPATVFLGGLVLGHCLRDAEHAGADPRAALPALQRVPPG